MTISDVLPPPFACASIVPMTLYALVAADSDYAIDLFSTLELAERALADVLFDEPGFASLLSVVPIAPPWDLHDDSAAPYVAPL